MSQQVLVTGGSRGIGRAIAARFADAGCKVFITGRADDLSGAAEAVGATGIPLDLADRNSISQLAEQVSAVDVLINNAGGFVGPAPQGSGDLHEIADYWERTLRVNLLGHVLVLTALEPGFSSGGSVVSIGSIGAEYAGNPYSVSKAALQAWTAGMSQRLGPRGVTVNAIAPGYVEGTNLFGGPLNPERYNSLIERTHCGRPGHPDDIAETAFFLTSAGARHITGQTIHVNGGAHTTR